MASVKGRGLVIAESASGESDRRVTILVKGKGKLMASARGARKTGSKFLAGTQLFTYADFVFYYGNTFYSVNTIDIINNFHDLRNDYDCFCLASYFAELTGAFTVNGEAGDDILLLTLVAFARLSGLGTPTATDRAVFELKLLQFAGFSPEWLVSRDCALSPGTRGAIFSILNSPVRSVFGVEPDDAAIAEIRRVTKRLIDQNMDVVKSSRFLET
jgi:DNA repair protein RecO (recombination protein O)